MICPHCGAEVPSRARTLMTGSLFVAAAVVLLLFVRLPVFILASVLMAVVGATMIRAAFKPRYRRCRRCGQPV